MRGLKLSAILPFWPNGGHFNKKRESERFLETIFNQRRKENEECNNQKVSWCNYGFSHA